MKGKRSCEEPVSEDKRFSYSCASSMGRTPNYHSSSTADRALPNSRALTPEGATRGTARRHSNGTYARHSEPEHTDAAGETASLGRLCHLLVSLQPARAQPQGQAARHRNDGSLAARARRQALE